MEFKEKNESEYAFPIIEKATFLASSKIWENSLCGKFGDAGKCIVDGESAEPNLDTFLPDLADTAAQNEESDRESRKNRERTYFCIFQDLR
jgi:hypothetical protein